MKAIPLTRGQTALVDDEDFPAVSRWRWCAMLSHGRFYAVRSDNSRILMHRFLLNPPTGLVVDHKNDNSLDNRRENLRICTNAQNVQHQRHKPGTSSYKGVARCKQTGRWEARIMKDRKQVWLGRWETETAAAQAYDRAARELFGEFALPNFPEVTP